MTASELIKMLKKLPPGAPIVANVGGIADAADVKGATAKRMHVVSGLYYRCFEPGGECADPKSWGEPVVVAMIEAVIE